MIGTIRLTAVAAGAAVALLLAAPGSASAKASCIFADLEVSHENVDVVERSLFCLTNLHRVRSGLEPVAIDTRLMGASRAHSDDMVARGFYNHISPEGLGGSDRAIAAGYGFGVGENIATSVEGTAESLFVAWLRSPGHNRNMLTPHYEAGGIGVNPFCSCQLGVAPGATGTQMFGVGPANTRNDALEFYASSKRCGNAMERQYRKRKARKRASGARKRRLGEQIRRLNEDVRRRCKPLPAG